MRALEVQGLAKRYGSVVALDGIDFDVGEGEIVGLLGPNGSGKTTTMRAILGLIASDRGEIRINGVRLEGTARSDRVGALVDRPAIYPHLTGAQNLTATAVALGLGRIAAAAAVRRLVVLLGLDAVEQRGVSSYSTGLRQRLGIALALLGDAKLIILDEPTNGLDPEGIAFVRTLIRELASEGRSVLLSSHLLDEVEHACDRVVIIVRGKVVAVGRPTDLVGSGIDLTIAFASGSEAQAAAVVLGSAGIDARVSASALLVPARGTEGAAVGRLLAENGLFPTELRSSNRRLEDLFLEITSAGDGGGR